MPTLGAIRDFTTTFSYGAVTSLACLMPDHESGDLLVAFGAKDFTGDIPSTSGSWTDQEGQSGAGHASRLATLVASSSSETLTFSLGGSARQMAAVVVAIRNPHASAPVNVTSVGAADTTPPFAGDADSTTQDNCLILHFIACDATCGMYCEAGWAHLGGGSGGNVGVGAAWSFLPSFGAYAAPDWWHPDDATNPRAVPMSIGVRLADATRVPPYSDIDQSDIVLHNPLYGATHAGMTWEATAFDISAIGSNTLTELDGPNDGPDIVPVLGAKAAVVDVTTVGAGSDLGGSQLNFDSATDLSDGYMLFSSNYETPGSWDRQDTIANSGHVVAFVEGTDYRAFSFAGLDETTRGRNAWKYWGVQVDQTEDTRFAEGGTFDATSINSIIWATQPFKGDISFVLAYLLQVKNPVRILGGSSTNPITFSELREFMQRCCYGYPLFQPAFGAAAMALAPIQIGGSDAVHMDISNSAIIFPTQSDPTGTKVLEWHVDADQIGFELYLANAADTIVAKNFVWSSESSFYWRFHASMSSSSTYTLTGAVVVKANVTLRSWVILSDMTFVGCTAFTQNGAQLSACLFDSFTAAMLCSDPGKISDSTFTSSGSGHAIEADTAGSYTLTDVFFSGYGAADTTDAAFYNNSGGAITLTIDGGDVPTVRNGAGASTTVISGSTVTLTITVKDLDDNSLLENVQVTVTAESGGWMPHQDAVTITRVTTTATVSHTAHGLDTGDEVMIKGALDPEYNGVHTITKVDDDSYTYTVSGTPTTPAPGIRMVDGQDETSYDNSPTTEGTFSGGTGHAVSDVITLDNGATVTVDAVSAGVVTEFTINAVDSFNVEDGSTVSQRSTTGSGTGFSIVVDEDNLTVVATGVIIHAETNASGVVSDTRIHSTNQPFEGRARESSASTYYKEGILSGTVNSSTGAAATVLMIPDE